jgi:ribosomal protein S18 acetylase RimI-like enzyme
VEPINATESVTIVKLPPDRWRDYRTLRLLALRTDPIAFGSTYDEARQRPEAWWRQRLADPRATFLFARVGEALAGTMGALLGDDDPRTALIVGAFVAPPYRNRGLGKALLRALLAEIAAHPQLSRVQLHVSESQAAAIALYTACGFAVTGQLDRLDHLGAPICREFIMERAVAPG